MTNARVVLLSSGTHSADARIHRLAGALTKNGYSVDLWSPGNSSDAPSSVTYHRAFGGRGFLGRILRDIALPFHSFRSDIVVVVSPDLIPLTYLLTRINRRKFIVDLYENFSKVLRDRPWAKGLIGAMAKLVAKVGENLAAKADITMVADKQVPPFVARRRLVIRNLPDRDLIQYSNSRDTSPRAIYIGDLRKSRGLFTMLTAIEKSPAWTLDLVGNISPFDLAEVERWRETSPARDRVRFHGRLAPAQSWKIAEGAWVGLSLLESTPAFVEAVPSKLYEYMAAGLAIISLPLPRCVELLDESKSGLIAANADEVSSILQHWGENRMAVEALARSGKQYADSHLNSDEEYAPLIQAIGESRG